MNVIDGEKTKKDEESNCPDVTERKSLKNISNILYETNLLKKDTKKPNLPKKDIKESNEKLKGSKIKEIEDVEEKKSVIIQIHTEFCDIERIEDDFYLVNREEIKLSFILCQSLKTISKNIIIYTFNIAQVNLFKEKFKKELSFVKIVLLNEDCTNFEYADYVIVSCIESEISEISKKK